MKTIFTIFLLLSVFTIDAQNQITGKATTHKGEPLPGVNIFIENTYDGASSDANGNFSFTTSEKGTQTLKATFIGFKPWQKEISIPVKDSVIIEMEESVNTLDAVTITAGSFAAADESRASIMKPLDIYTTPSANGDVMAAMRTMPGTQTAADDGRLMVRGGDVYETKTYIDGLIAAEPYYSKTPDIATRGRFAPSLFSGVMFSSGGYSAEYGQALSSVLVLNSNDLAAEDVTGVSLMSIGAEASTTQRMKNSSLSLTGGYTNLSLYDKLFESTVDWEKPVESVNGTAVYRYKTKDNGLLKGYITTDYGNLSYFAPTDDPAAPMLISNKGATTYSNLSYRDCFSEKACYKIGVSSTAQNNKLGFGDNSLDTRERNVEGRFTTTHIVSDGVIINWGVSETYNNYDEDYSESTGFQHNSAFTDYLTGAFVESEIKFTKNLAIRPGLRTEYTTVLNRWNMSPRFAVALKTGKEAQLSAAWGLYYQNPQPEYLKISTDLDFEKATHYILSYQYGDASARLFRAEAYYKTYSDLVTWQAGPYNQPTNLENDGSGYSGGFDIFWRDLKSIKGFDYWVTYSFVDTKRRYSYFPVEATPGFISDHTFSAVGKYWLAKISTQVGMSFTAASGRPYNDPQSAVFMDKKTKPYTDLSLNFSHVFYLGNQYSVLYCSVNNVLGNDNVLSYRPSGISEAQGDYTLVPVKRDIKRFVFVGLFLNF